MKIRERRALPVALGVGLCGWMMTVAVGQPSGPVPADVLRSDALSLTGPLDSVQVRDAPNFKIYVRDRQALRVLGKALFWDQQVGSDGMACASCHFHSGADNRTRNQLNPGFRDTRFSGGDTAFTPPFGPDYPLTAADFPLRRLTDPEDADSAVLFDTNDVVSSSGVFNRRFVSIGIPSDLGSPDATGSGAVFHVNGDPVRNVEPRNTPSTLAAVLNHRNFWDGRARNHANGVNPIGELDPTVRLVKVTPLGNTKKGPNPVFVQIRVNDSSASSQADGPPESDLEMAFIGRRMPMLARKMMSPSLTALGQQLVATDDSVLGGVSAQHNTAGAKGITARYRDLIQTAFEPQWWDAPGWYVDVSTSNHRLVKGNITQPNTQFTVMEYNFGLYFGLAVHEYEKVLIPSDTPFDRFLKGDLSALTSQQQEGLQVFLGRGKCINCHGGAELTNASITNVKDQLIERMIMGDNRVAVYDNGFYNIGVRPTAEDLGVGARIGPKNLPLSFSRFFQEKVQTDVRKLSRTMPLEDAIRQANRNAGVPRIRARPEDALTLLTRAFELLGSPEAAAEPLRSAESLLAAHDVMGGSAVLVQVRELLATLAPGTPDASEVLALLREATSVLPDPVDPGPDPQKPYGPPLRPDERVAVDGAHKTPALRNVALTAPYFHNGGQATLAQVVEFYNRGGDFRRENRRDLDPDIQRLGLSTSERAALVAFLEQALTDDRVVYERAPFDRPSLSVPHDGPADLIRLELPAVGREGNGVGLGTPASSGTPFGKFLMPLAP